MTLFIRQTKLAKELNQMPTVVLRLNNWSLEKRLTMILPKLENKVWNNYNAGKCYHLWTMVGRIMFP